MVAQVTVRSIEIDVQFCPQHFKQCDIQVGFDFDLSFDASLRLGDVHLVLSLYQQGIRPLCGVLPYNNREVRMKNYSLPDELDETKKFMFGFRFQGPDDNSIEVFGKEKFSEVFIGKWSSHSKQE